VHLRHAPVLVAAALVLSTLGRWPLWQDEAFSWALVQGTLGEIIDGAAGDRHPPLYYLIVATLSWIVDRDELIRLPSALAFVGAVALVGSAARRHFGDAAGFVAGLVVALSPVAVLHAMNARMYAMLLFWGAAMTWGGLELVRGDRPRRGAAVVGLAAAGAVWTHYAGLAAIAAAGLGAALGCFARTDLPWRERGTRVAWLVGAMGLAGASFIPWAMGPLQFQLTNKDAPAERTFTVLAYALWNFDSRVPPLSWALAAAQLVGLGVALRRRDATTALLFAWAAAAVVFPWYFSSSLPAQNPRNYLAFLPVGAVLVGLALARWPRLAAGGLALFAVEPMVDLLTRQVSPQETGVGFDYQLEADVFDASVPANAGLYFRPKYLITQYRRYAPALETRAAYPVGPEAWLASPRTEFLDSAITARYTEDCTFEQSFRVVLYAPDGPGCDAMKAWIRAGADAGYPPFLMEEGARALSAGNLADAEAWLVKAAAVTRAHPAAWISLTDVYQRSRDGERMLAAADEALAIAKAWHFPGRVIGGVLDSRARALVMLGREPEAAAVRAAANCARTSSLPTLCGTWAEGVVKALPALESPPPTLPPLPSLTEAQDAAPPAAAPNGASRLALWALDGEALPATWVDNSGTPDAPAGEMLQVDGTTALVMQVTPERPAAVLCAALVDAAPRMALRARWRLAVDGEQGWTRLVLEARMADAEGTVKKVLDQPVAERPLQTATATSWRVDRFDFRTTDAEKVRLCVKLEGKVPATATLDWIELSKVDE
jgi:hypothetical protein